MPTVLIVDDSPTAREMLAELLASDPDIEVIGFAKDGHEALEKTKELKPDVITMDINMPKMGGLEATQEIMIEAPTPIVIVSASARAQEVKTSMKALRCGALTLLRKPTASNAPDFQSMSKEIIDTVKAMADVMVIRHRRRLAPKQPAPDIPPAVSPDQPNNLKAIGIVCSTGGPPAVATVLSGLPVDFPVPILLVQHIVPGFAHGFASWLDSVVGLHVKVADDHELAQPGCVYVAPHDKHLGVSRTRRIRLLDDEPIGGFRPAGNYLFESLADNLGKDTAGVIMTGMGQDGAQGLMKLREAGGRTVAQDEESCVVFGMPRAAIELGAVEVILPLDRIANHLIQLALVKV